MTQVEVVSGDITEVKADALLTLVTSDQEWNGAVDFAIRRVAGRVFHDELLLRRMSFGLRDGATQFVAQAGNSHPFKGVMFIVDNFEQPLDDLVVIGLNEAKSRGLTSVSLPVMRTGAAAGVYEADAEEAALAQVSGIKRFLEITPPRLQKITVVVYQDPRMEALLRHELALV